VLVKGWFSKLSTSYAQCENEAMHDRVDDSSAPWDREETASRSLMRLIAESTNDGIWDWNLNVVCFSRARLMLALAI
jgi:hypothetical protein